LDYELEHFCNLNAGVGTGRNEQKKNMQSPLKMRLQTINVDYFNAVKIS
jgi:hypothetical protein